MDARFERRRHDHQRDATLPEIAPEPCDRRARIGRDRAGIAPGRSDFARGGPGHGIGSRRDPPLQLRRIEEAAAGHVVDVRPIEQPPLAPEIDALVAGPEPAGDHDLRRRPELLREQRIFIQRLLELTQTGDDGLVQRGGEPPHVGALHGRGPDLGADRTGQIDQARPGRRALDAVPGAPAHPLDEGNQRDRRQEKGQQEARGQRRDGGVLDLLERELLPVRSARWQWLVGWRHQKMK